MVETSVLLQLEVHVLGWVVNLLIGTTHFVMNVNWQ